MEEVPISKFRARFFRFVEGVRTTKEPIRITRYGAPVVEVVPLLIQNRSIWIGSMKDSIEILGDIVSPANDESE